MRHPSQPARLSKAAHTANPANPASATNATATVIRRRRARRQTMKQARSQRSLAMLALAAVLLLAGAVATAGAGVVAAVGVYFYFARDLPPPAEITRVRQQFETTLIYDRSGEHVLYEVLDPSGDRQSVPLAEIPRDLINATIAIEDRTFYTNPGFDLRGVLRAAWVALQNGQVQGASTITQQLVKNTLIEPERRTEISQTRKIQEVILAAEISRLYSKDQILEWYLNTNFYGNLAYGVGTAAQVYFGKPVQDLTLGESAMLAAIPQNPYLNPIDDWIAARQRQAVVLQSMVEAGMVSADEARGAASETVVIRPPTERYGILAPHFAIYARQQAEEILNGMGLDGARLVLGNGLRIYTTLDLDLQYQAECVMRAYAERIAGGNPNAAPNTGDGGPCQAVQYLPTPPGFPLGVGRPVTNAASVVIRPATGEILSMVGSLDYYNAGIQGNFNAALGLRQPASTFKPFVYVTAFASPEHDYTPASMVLDVPTTFNQGGLAYTPRNEDGQFHGPMSIRSALANSYNIPVVRVLSDVTIGQVLRRARQMGLSTLTRPLDEYGLALALGSGEVTLVDLTYAYSVFANLGVMAGTPVQNPRPGFRGLDPVAVLRIEDRNGSVLWQFDERQSSFARQNVLSDALAYLITDILSDNRARVPAFGEGNALQLSRPAAAKTGTSNDNRDAWTVGYTPFAVAGVWLGNNDNAPMGDDVTGATAAAPIWRAIMEYLHNRDANPAQGWPRPPTIVEAAVCETSGLLPNADCPRVRELFYEDPATGTSTIPRQPDIYWKRYSINARNGLRATASTPPDQITERVYFDYPPEALTWAREAGMPLPPSEYDTAGATAADEAGGITAPTGLDRVRGVVEIRGDLGPETASYLLEYGAGINPVQWFAIGSSTAGAGGDDVPFGAWDTSGLNGLYTLRLGLILNDQSFVTRTIQVTVDNTPPLVTVAAPTPGAEAKVGALRLEVNASDDVELAQVEFFWNDRMLTAFDGASNEGNEDDGPFVFDWQVLQTGPQTFYAVATDRAGNTARSETVTVTVVN
ncbi:MAG: transglycosylase domain-containing protein [Anaerolineae bacterium]|nr:transglycosylase domain-containing protein [Anaerolineae bacterium]